jgi:hypothetical protein
LFSKSLHILPFVPGTDGDIRILSSAVIVSIQGQLALVLFLSLLPTSTSRPERNRSIVNIRNLKRQFVVHLLGYDTFLFGGTASIVVVVVVAARVFSGGTITEDSCLGMTE